MVVVILGFSKRASQQGEVAVPGAGSLCGQHSHPAWIGRIELGGIRGQDKVGSQRGQVEQGGAFRCNGLGNAPLVGNAAFVNDAAKWSTKGGVVER